MTIRSTILPFAAALTLCGTAQADTLQDILDSGVIRIGIKADYAPWGMRDEDGNVVGLEIDLVEDFVKRLNEKYDADVKLEKVVVTGSNRLQFLQQGKIDMMIATMSDKPERREVVGIVMPDYYSSGVTILARNGSGIDGWDSVKGKTICGIQGAWYNKEYGTKKGADMKAFKGVPEVEAAMLDGRCDGWLYDDSAFVPRKVNEPEKWADFEMATPVVADVPWGAAVRLEDLGTPIAQELSEAIIEWHASGMIVEGEKKWGIPTTEWVQMMQKACAEGEKICDTERDADETWELAN